MRFRPQRSPEEAREELSERRLPSPREEARVDALLEGLVRAGGEGIRGASEAAVEAAEGELGVPFPASYRRFLLLAGGASRAPGWRGLWRVDELVSLNRSLPLFQWFGGLVGVGNEGFLVYALDYRAEGEEPPLVTLGLSSSDPADVTALAERFEDWLRETLPPV
ncbi:MAG TPA: SMI1/KNR4 family protein [Planctomycetota bacterium]|jgi:hypothetical protein|nr:SMI1/KNR4 family protein [Planctomycetota bacterium]